VSHHPPIGVSETSSDKWCLKQEVHVKTKFHGNSIDIFAMGRTYFIVKATGQSYSWKVPNTCVHNIFVGGMWIETWGDFKTKSKSNQGEKLELKFQKSGWFGDGKHCVSGYVIDGNRKNQISFDGKWSTHLKAIHVKKEKDEKTEDLQEFFLWEKVDEKTDNKWKLPPFSLQLLSFDQQYEKILPLTDSRIRPDRRALESGDNATASREKNRIECLQRKQNHADFVSPNFKRSRVLVGSWDYIGTYWENRQMRKDKLIQNI